MRPTNLAVAAVVLSLAAPALAQHEHHSGPAAPAQSDPVPPAPAGDHSGHGADQARPAIEPVPSGPATDHAGHDVHQASPAANAAGGGHAMTGALGSYAMQREASGTSWQPDAARHGGVHARAGSWTLMGHLNLNAVYDWQEGPRGDEKAFLSGMVMGTARRPVGAGTLQIRTMLSPDPLMGRRGYPLHLAAGETADGLNPLVDRQHPHDFFMELSASLSLPLSDRVSAFVYAGLPGEPAFGPPAFMHRMSIMDSPEAPITHHWLDSTHISFGVVTAGLVMGNVKIEASRFNGREPDERRYDIETAPLDSTALRLSWNPTPNLSLQASWAHLVGPEQLEPDEKSTRWSASAIYTRPIGSDGWWSTTAAWGRRSSDHEQLDAALIESAVAFGPWTIFGRAEYAENNELIRVNGHHGPTYKVGKLSLGAIHDFTIAPSVRLGIGGQFALNFLPRALEPAYGGQPKGAMGFIRLKVE